MARDSRKRLLLVKTETEANYGVDASPVGIDALEARSLEITPLAGEVVERTKIRPYFGSFPEITASDYLMITAEFELVGSGAAGTAPGIGKLLTCCNMAETVTGAAVTGTATAGAANSITLAAGASAVDDFYNGQVLSITGGTGNGSVFLVTDYVGSTKVATLSPFDGVEVTPDNTSDYSVSANVTYSPSSEIEGSDDTSATLYYFIDDILHKGIGARGSFSFDLNLRQIPVIRFMMTALNGGRVDQDVPTPTYGAQASSVDIFRAGNTGAFGFHGASQCISALSFDLGNTVEYIERVGCVKRVEVKDRAANGSALIEAPLFATKDYFQAALDNDLGELHFLHGTAAGNRIGFVAPTTSIGQPTYEDEQQEHMLRIPYRAIPTAPGNNEFRLVFQ